MEESIVNRKISTNDVYVVAILLVVVGIIAYFIVKSFSASSLAEGANSIVSNAGGVANSIIGNLFGQTSNLITGTIGAVTTPIFLPVKTVTSGISNVLNHIPKPKFLR